MHILPHSLWLLIAMHLSAASATHPRPTAIRKMPPDAGEKFYRHYLAFDQPQPQAYAPAIAARQPYLEADNRLLSTNTSALLDLRPAFAPISDHERSYHAFQAIRRLRKRQWACPGGTNSCTSIGYPNSCCQTGETCVVIQDTGLGPVGCCPSGSACGGTVAGCAAGNTPCGSDIGGGCCIPGYVCEGVGCVYRSTATATQASTTSTPSTTVVIPPTTTTSSSITSPPSSTSQPSVTTSQSASAPVRPTSSSSSPSNSICPTGFYACLARAGGGCCQTGRDCQTTSCPPPASSTTLISNGLTIAVPASGVPATTTAACATGWFLCGTGSGPIAGCCPSGYGCGTASCSLETGGATATVAKELPGQNSAGRRRIWNCWAGIALPGIMVVMFI